MSVRIGVINWDCSLPSDTYFGFHQTRSLSPAKYRRVTPFYADILGEDKIGYHFRSQEEFDRELTCAIDAGIDYFAYVWYPDEGSRRHTAVSENDCSGHVWELNYARRMHCASELRERIRVCPIAGAHPFTDGDLEDLARALQEPYYETVDGRPLVYVFGGCRADFITRLRQMCARVGTPDPYVAAMYNAGVPGDADLSACEALSAYACTKSGVTKYAEVFAQSLEDNEKRRRAGKAVIPLFTTGWDPSPRVDSPVPWYGYPDENYAAFASEEELLGGARRLAEWIKTAADGQFIGHILSFAWNEFEEGGIICPTVGADGAADTARLEAFARVTQVFRDAL